MSRILDKFYTEVKGEDFLTFNPGILLGGTLVDYNQQQSEGNVFGKSNVVSQSAVVYGGLRFISEDQNLVAMSFVFSLNALVNSMMLTPRCPKAGPTGGAGFAFPASICSLM